MKKRSVYCGKKAGRGDRRVGINDRRGGAAPKRVGTNADWDDIREKRAGTNDRRVGINSRKVGITDKRAGKRDRRVGINADKGGINVVKVGITDDWENLREKRVGITNRRGGTNKNAGSEKVGIKITQNRQRILDGMAENPRVTMEELSAAVGISLRKIETNVQKLKAAGLIDRIGARKNGHWAVNLRG